MPAHSQSNLHLAVKYLEGEHLQSYYKLYGHKREPWGQSQHFAFLFKAKTAAHSKATVATVTVPQGCRVVCGLGNAILQILLLS